MKGLKRVYRELPHTADLAIEVRGRDLKELFKNAALSLVDLAMADEVEVRPVDSVRVEAQGSDLEDLLVRFLSEVHYVVFGKMFVFSDISIEKLDEKKFFVSARVFGEQFDPGRHEFEVEIKAVTYHMVEVKRDSEGWIARVVFDV